MVSMTKIEVSTKIQSSIDKVWDIISDLDNEVKYWKGTKEIRNISKEGNNIKREVIIAFRDSKCLQEVTLHPKEKIVMNIAYSLPGNWLNENKTYNFKYIKQSGIYVYLNHNLIQAIQLGAIAHIKVDGEWDNDLMEQIKTPSQISLPPHSFF